MESTPRPRKHTDRHVEQFYDDLIYGVKANLSASRRMLGAFPFPRQEQLPNLSVLEVGIGRGEWSLALSFAKHYTACDLSSKTIGYVKSEFRSRQGPHNGNFVRGSVLSLPFPESCFDVVFCIGVLHVTGDPEQGFRELYRALKPGGTMNIMLYGSVQPRNIIRDVIYQISRLGERVRRVILGLAIALERFHLPDVFFFNGGGSDVLYRDWYFAPIQSHHTVAEVRSWANEVGGDVTYVFLDPYRNTLKTHKRLARSRMFSRLLCPDFMVSVRKP